MKIRQRKKEKPDWIHEIAELRKAEVHKKFDDEALTVGELIEILRKFDKNKIVGVETDPGKEGQRYGMRALSVEYVSPKEVGPMISPGFTSNVVLITYRVKQENSRKERALQSHL